MLFIGWICSYHTILKYEFLQDSVIILNNPIHMQIDYQVIISIVLRVVIHSGLWFFGKLWSVVPKKDTTNHKAKQNITVIFSQFRDCLNVLTIGWCDLWTSLIVTVAFKNLPKEFKTCACVETQAWFALFEFVPECLVQKKLKWKLLQ